MRVKIKAFDVAMEIKSKGIEFEVRSADDKEQIGDCSATMTGLTWCKGKTGKGKGIKLKWEGLKILCSSKETLKAAIKAAAKSGTLGETQTPQGSLVCPQGY